MEDNRIKVVAVVETPSATTFEQIIKVNPLSEATIWRDLVIYEKRVLGKGYKIVDYWTL